MPLLSDVLGKKPQHDSRKVERGDVFVAIKGTAQDGTRFAPMAVEMGASAIVSESAIDTVDVPVIEVANARRALVELAAAYYTQQPQHIMAVTGTNGKTSVADFCRQFCAAAGEKSASIGTLGWNGDTTFLGDAFGANNTSPDPLLLHKGLQQLAEHDVQYAALEASSHGLDQIRLDGARITSAAFTNLSHDHLDYHKDMQHYLQAKLRLFAELLPEGAPAIIHADDGYSAKFIEVARARNHRITTVGTHGIDLRIDTLRPVAEGIATELECWGTKHTITLPLYGAFQVSNALVALGLVVAEGLDKDAAFATLPNLRGVPGRLQHIAEHNGALIFIDYAHTPDALQTILLTLRPHCEGKLHVVFGCGGDRDKTKRPEMGKVAARYADSAIVTDDNPRSEDAATIRSEIMAACPDATEIAGRAEAIAHAVQQLESGDVLVVAGKGHEDYQIIGEQTLHFNDAEQIREAVSSS